MISDSLFLYSIGVLRCILEYSTYTTAARAMLGGKLEFTATN